MRQMTDIKTKNQHAGYFISKWEEEQLYFVTN